MQTQPVEDIDAVLGRFRAWTGARNAAEAKPGIRELSYEEALRSRRYRWKAGNDARAKKPGADLGVGPGVVRVAAPVAEPKSVPERPRTAAMNAPDTKQRTGKKVRGGDHRSEAAMAAKAAPAAKSVPGAKAGRGCRPESKPEFREVLAEAVRPAEVMVAAQPMELARQVAISIRLAPAERALIKTRAAEAGLSASAYIRQCALEVEQLRAQVQQTLAAMERKGPASVVTSAAAAAPGFFARVMRRFFPATARSLALRV